MACITPYAVKKKTTGETVPVPCGKCPDCVGRRISGWSFRLMQQEKISMSSYFITLTYDTAHVPITRAGFMSLNKRHIQLFYKRLRKLHASDTITSGMPSIKYFTVGEYGGKTNRPHYHAILFNVHLPHIQRAWQYGSVHYGKVSGASVGYTLKYIHKAKKIPMHRNDDRIPEFALMSKGLGQNYLTNKMVKWHHADLVNRMYVTTSQGQKVSMPRYYKQKIYTESEMKQIGHFAIQKALDKMVEHELEMEQLHGENAKSVQVQIHKQKFQKLKADGEKNKWL